MAQYPNNTPTNADLYIALDNFSTTLSIAIDNSQTTISLTSVIGLPTVGILTIDSEKIKYTGISGNDITGCTRGFSATSAASHTLGATVMFNIVEEHHNVIKDEVIAVATDLRAVQAALNDVDTPASTAADVKDRLDQVVSEIKRVTGNTNWYDTVANNLTQLLPLSGGTLTGALAVPLGSVGSPSLAFSGDSNTGICQPGVADSWAVATGGVLRFSVENAYTSILNTLLIANGSVTSPSISFSDLDNGIFYIGTDNWGLSAGGIKVIDLNPNGVGILGTNTNNSALTGFVGQYIESIVTTLTNFPSSGTFGDFTSISLSAGDWDVSLIGELNDNGASITDYLIGISTTSGTGDGTSIGNSRVYFSGITSTYITGNIPSFRVSLSSLTTVYFKYYSNYAVATPRIRGGIHARRVR